MILADIVLGLVGVALLLRRDLGAIGQLTFRGGWQLAGMVISLYLLQVGFVWFMPGRTVFQAALLVLTQVALAFLLWLNRHLPGAKLFVVGILLNVLVILANGGWMPLTPQMHRFLHPGQIVVVGDRLPYNKSAVLPSADTRLWFLADIIPISLPWRRTVVSVGDICLAVAAAQFILQKQPRRAPPNQQPLPQLHRSPPNPTR